MTDPFSVAAGIAGLTSLGIKVTESLVKFYTLHKERDANVARTTAKLENLQNTFQCLDTALQNRKVQLEEQDLIRNIESSIQQCDKHIQELQNECEKLETDSTLDTKGAIKVAGHRIAYPFRQSTLMKLDEDVGEIHDNLSLALHVLQLEDHTRTQDNIAELKSLVELVKASQVSSTIRDWLKAPDATADHNTACGNHHSGTGMWFVKGSCFDRWLNKDNSFIWLNGFAGCGKSVLCSTAVKHTFRRERHELGVGIAFFYFRFDDNFKQDASAMIRGLLLQLSAQLGDGHADLAHLHTLYNPGTPPMEALIAYLHRMIQKFNRAYILLDALDESPQHSQREDVLNVLEKMRGWRLTGLHLLVTSRDVPDIRESLRPTDDQDIAMKNVDIDKDITTVISYQLNNDPRLQKWQAYHDEIQKTLAERAQGM